MNVLCNCGGRTPCIQRFCDSIPLVQARTDDVLAVADCIEEVRQAEPAELAELTAQWKMLVRAKFRKAVAALNEPGAVLPGAAPAAAPAAPVPTAAAPPPPQKPSNGGDACRAGRANDSAAGVSGLRRRARSWQAEPPAPYSRASRVQRTPGFPSATSAPALPRRAWRTCILAR